VPAALKNSSGEMLIDLKVLNSFAEIKRELGKKLRSIDSYLLGTQVSIDIGNKQLSNKQIREIEDILLDHGLHLKDLRSNSLPGIYNIPDKESQPFGFNELPNYDETKLVCRHLRSGQKFITGGNMVILGDINPGAEVIAGGNILVIGALKGMVHAGAFGDENAVVAAFRLNPTQLRIANHITRPPDGEVIVVNNPELARIKAGKVIIEKLKI